MADKDKQYSDIGVLYSFTSDIGSGYLVKRWVSSLSEKEKTKCLKNQYNGLPSYVMDYMNEDFTVNTEFVEKRRSLQIDVQDQAGYKKFQILKGKINLEKKVVEEESILAKWALYNGSVELKALIYSNIEKIKKSLNDDNIENVDKLLIKILEEMKMKVQ